MPVLAVGLLHVSEFEVGVLAAAGTIAFLVVGLPAGAWVDRWVKRRVMIAADLVRVAGMLAVPVLWWSGVLQVWHLYLIAVVVGIATVFFDVSYQSIVPLLVHGEQVADANSKLEGTAQISRIGGPALGGGLLTIISAPVLFVGEALGYFASAVFLWRTKVSEQAQPKAERRPLVVEIKEGLVFVAKHALLRRIVICTAASNFFGNISATLLPILVLRHLDLGAAGLGIVLSVGAVGGLLGAIAVPRLAGWVGEGPLIPISSIAFSLALLLVPLSATLPSQGLKLSVLIVGEFISSFGILAYNVMQVSMRQRVCPPKLLGRMNASIRFVIFGVMPIAGILSGVLGSWLGLLPTMWIGVLGGLLAPVAVVFSPLWQMRKLPDSVDYSAASV